MKQTDIIKAQPTFKITQPDMGGYINVVPTLGGGGGL